MADRSARSPQEQPLTGGSAPLLDPTSIATARQIYRAHQQIHPERRDRPLGVVVDRQTQRGVIIFQNKPLLLPHECFVPFHIIDPS